MTRLGVRVVPWLVVVVTWVALWGNLKPGTVVGGAIAGVLVVALLDARHIPLGTLRPVAFVRFLAWMTWAIVKATTLVAWEVITPGNRIVEGIIAVPLPDATPTVVNVVSNCIGLTPGTVVVDLDEDPCVLYVHVLHLRDIESVRADLVELEVVVMRAFGSAATLAAADRLEAGSWRPWVTDRAVRP